MEQARFATLNAIQNKGNCFRLLSNAETFVILNKLEPVHIHWKISVITSDCLKQKGSLMSESADSIQSLGIDI